MTIIFVRAISNKSIDYIPIGVETLELSSNFNENLNKINKFNNFFPYNDDKYFFKKTFVLNEKKLINNLLNIPYKEENDFIFLNIKCKNMFKSRTSIFVKFGLLNENIIHCKQVDDISYTIVIKPEDRKCPKTHTSIRIITEVMLLNYLSKQSF